MNREAYTENKSCALLHVYCYNELSRLNKSSKSFYMTKNLRLEWLTCPVKCYGELRSLPGRKINLNGPSVELSLRVEEKKDTL